MSVTELQVPMESRGQDRTPPNDVVAEQSVIGAMLLSKDAIADVVEVVVNVDHQLDRAAGHTFGHGQQLGRGLRC